MNRRIEQGQKTIPLKRDEEKNITRPKLVFETAEPKIDTNPFEQF